MIRFVIQRNIHDLNCNFKKYSVSEVTVINGQRRIGHGFFYDQLWFSRGFLTVSTGWVEKRYFSGT